MDDSKEMAALKQELAEAKYELAEARAYIRRRILAESEPAVAGRVNNGYELGKRAVACAHWRWMPGMLLLPHVDGCECCEDRNFPRRAARIPAVFTTDIDVPDLSDPATLGCLLHLVRQAQPNQGRWIMSSCCNAYGRWYTNPSRGGGRDYDTEAEALVDALEAAP